MTTWMKAHFQLIHITIFSLSTKGRKFLIWELIFLIKILLRTGKIAQDLKHNLDLLIGTPLLKAEQKFQ